MKPIYIHSAVSISRQNSFSEGEMIPFHTNNEIAPAIHPRYRDYIAPAMLRRMAPAVKMGVTAAKKALADANVQQPDAILTGSGMGCMKDTEIFLNALIKNKEMFLTPTAFIQSTHNTVGAQIALGLQCKAYNNTYVHGSLSFESAVLDAQLLLQEGTKNVLVGGVDELGTEFVHYKDLLDKQQVPSRQVPLSEGASFFVFSSEVNGAKVQLSDITTFSIASETDITEKMRQFLKENHLSVTDIDMLLLGNTGNGYDVLYDTISANFSVATKQIPFKEYAGEYDTVAAFALWLGCQKLTNSEKNTTILIYNQEQGMNHSFMILSSC